MSIRSVDIMHQARLLLAEEQRLAAALSDVRTRLNELTLVALLPTDILEDIFSICVSWLYEPYKPVYRLAWTQVCRNWRNISLNSARLWRLIDLRDSRLAHEFLIRSKAAPISLISSLPVKPCTENLQHHSDRLTSIDVYLFPDDMMALFDSIGPNLPNVTSLSLKIPLVSTNFILNVQAPRLTRLVLDCVGVSWNTWHDLTHFSLRGLGVEHSPSIAQILSMFKSSPQLEYIRLEAIVPAFSEDPAHPPQSILLPRLRELILSSRAPVIYYLLSELVIPLNTRIQLHCSTFDDLHSLFPVDRPWPTSEVTTFRLARRAVSFLRPGAESWSDDPSDSFISVSSPSPIYKPILSRPHSILDLACFTTLELCSGVLPEIPSDALMDLFVQAKNLETLRIASNDLEEIIRVLIGPPAPSPEPICCPHLKTLSFGKPDYVWVHFKEEWIQLILILARSRYSHLAPITSLEFNQCRGVLPQTVVQFKGVVLEVSVREHSGVAGGKQACTG